MFISSNGLNCTGLAQPVSSGCDVEGVSSGACFHTQLTQFVCLILFNRTDGQETEILGLAIFISFEGFVCLILFNRTDGQETEILGWQSLFLLKGLCLAFLEHVCF